MSALLEKTRAAHPGCPKWCIAIHSEDNGFHYQLDVPVNDIYGASVEVSAFWNSATGKAGIYVGDREFDIDDIPALKAAIERAEAAARNCGRS